MPEGPIIDVTKVSDKGQVVIPKEIRDKLQLTPGTKLIVVATDEAIVLQRLEAVTGKMRIRDIMDIARSLTDRLKVGNSYYTGSSVGRCTRKRSLMRWTGAGIGYKAG